jgi:hypothetical protein
MHFVKGIRSTLFYASRPDSYPSLDRSSAAFRAQCCLVWFTSKSLEIANQDLTLTLGSDTIQAIHVVRDLGEWLGSKLTMKRHILKVSCINLIVINSTVYGRLVDQDVTARLVLTWLCRIENAAAHPA